MFRKLNLFPSSSDRRETLTLVGPLERDNLNHWMLGPKRIGVSLSSPKDENKSSFPNVVFPNCLELLLTDKVLIPSNSEDQVYFSVNQYKSN
jgi:hypothetical protein